ncbi:OLC1v1035306C1 [Oldenlandia corymbosa var. corymbosa]|uniref:OLC1v1035306C1 n=1 Tax=Oldenlandia corymbosa var. corymbosa TaxID=529605 RepID=A0AAV1CVX8_OLDCO|nr:OLC1v1035306C1 [Oldenlandia corymbosa var. corymbosa]
MSRLSVILAIIAFLLATKCPDVCGRDEALIKEVCKDTPHPDFCKLCMREEPKHDLMDPIEVGRASTECSIKKTFRVDLDLDDIAEGSIDVQVRDVCLTCKAFMKKAVQSLDAAQRHLDGKRFRDATNVAGEARDYHRKCTELIQGVKDFPVTGTFNIDFEILRRFYINVVAILSQLE